MTVLWPVLIPMVLVIVANTLINQSSCLQSIGLSVLAEARAGVMEIVHRLPLSYLIDKQGSGD